MNIYYVALPSVSELDNVREGKDKIDVVVVYVHVTGVLTMHNGIYMTKHLMKIFARTLCSSNGCTSVILGLSGIICTTADVHVDS